MQHPIHPCAGFRRATSCALRLALHGTGLVLIGAGTALTGTGRVLKVYGRTLRIIASASPRRNSTVPALPTWSAAVFAFTIPAT